MKDRRLARRYAKALLDLGVEEKMLPRFQDEMKRLTEALQKEPGLLKFLSYREVALEKKKKMIEGLIQTFLLSPWMQSFLDLLLTRGRITILPTIAAVFEELVNETENVVVAKVTTADKKSVEGLKESLRRALEKMTGKKVKFEIEEKKNLIGGLKVAIGDTIYDASLSGQLAKIKEQWL